IAGAVIPTVEKMQKDEEGRKKVTQWTRYATVVLAAVQGWGFALFTSSLENAVINPGFGFKLQMVTVLTAGAIFVMWLGEQIPQRTMARGRQREAAKNFIPLRINAAGVMPIIFASSVIVVPGAIAQFSGSAVASQWAEKVAPGTWAYYLLTAILIVFFTYFYT